MKMVKIIAFAGFVAFTGNQAFDAQTRILNPASQASFYVMGIVIRNLIEQLVYTALEPLRSGTDETLVAQNPELAKRLQKASDADFTSWVKGVSIGILSGFKVNLGDVVSSNLSPSTAKVMTTAFDGGTKFGALQDFILKGAEHVGTLASAFGSLVAIISSLPSSVHDDLGYPIRFGLSTMLDCGPQDPYCLAIERANQQADFQGVADLVESANVLAQEGISLSVGIIIAMLAYEVSVAFAKNAAQFVLTPYFGSYLSLVIQKTIERYIQLSIMNELYRFFIDLARDTFLVEGAGLTEAELEKRLKLGYKEEVGRKIAIPIHKKIIGNFFKALGLY